VGIDSEAPGMITAPFDLVNAVEVGVGRLRELAVVRGPVFRGWGGGVVTVDAGLPMAVTATDVGNGGASCLPGRGRLHLTST